jgi:lipoprotein-anchoring transpeptidase ErfK/SrfK
MSRRSRPTTTARDALFAATIVGATSLAFATNARHAWADEGAPPWTDRDEVPMAEGIRSVIPRKSESAIYAAPGKLDARRGSVMGNARLPFFGTRRGAGCSGRWLNVGPLAWICSDVAELSEEEPLRPIPPHNPTGLPFRYFFAGRDGAQGYSSLSHAEDETPDTDLEHGFGVAVVGERTGRNGEHYGLTRSGFFVPLKDLVAARTSAFHGEKLAPEAPFDLAWVLPDHASVFRAPKTGAKPTSTRVRFEVVHVSKVEGPFARTSPDGTTPEEWMKLADLARPTLAAPPAEVGGQDARERWIDVELASQTLVAYDGKVPAFATLVSTGKGPPKSELGTHLGVHRIWVKLLASKMDNLERDDVEHHYSLEDVPWVQFFDKAIALHGVFWHQQFGHVHSHGCVNLAPLDAESLFAFTGPHLPGGWSAVFPTKIEPGTAIRIR